MSEATYRVVKWAPGYDLGAFDCGEPTCNEWLVHHAATSVQAGVCAVYLLERIGDSTRVVGYYASNPTQVVRDVIPGNTTRGWPQTVPGWKLAKLAGHLDRRADQAAQ